MPSSYRFGHCEVRSIERQLLLDGNPAVLGARAFDLLITLIERRDRVVGKNELFDVVWPGVVVEENNLQVQVSSLRKLLGPQAIATVPGRGYRFALPLDEEIEPPNREILSSGAPKIGPASADASTDAPRLYGRAEELAALRELIERHPLVTITGPGGIGKTRLAEAIARRVFQESGDGWLVELASLADADLVAATVARATGHPVSDPFTAVELLVKSLESRSALLVLDNCEHLLEAVNRLVAALRKGAPRVRILVTSQELLKHSDEHVYRLGPLALPDDSSTSNVLSAAAVELFVARAQAAEPRFALSDSNVGAVVDVCRRLDGIPLALELAAARVPLLGVDGVRDRLDERFRLLTGGSRIALRRHQTIRAMHEWSFALLSRSEQMVFEKLGVFAGGFSLELAQQLCTDETIDPWTVLDHLGALVDKSLALVDPGEPPRYRLLETSRAFALELLAARGTTQQMLRRHAQVVLQLFEDHYIDNLRGRPPAEQVRRLLPDLDNLRAALRWAGESSADRHLAIAMIGAASAYYGFLWEAALQWEGRKWCETLKPAVDDSISPSCAARFWLACAELGASGSIAECVLDARRAVALYRAANDRLGTYMAYCGLGHALNFMGQMHEAGRAFDEASHLLDPTWPPRMRAIFEDFAALYFADAEPTRARAHLERYLSLAREGKSTIDEQIAIALLADLEVQLGQPERAVEIARDLINGRASIDAKDGLQHRNLATALMESGALDEAESVFREALMLVRRAYGSGAFVLDDMALLLARRGRLADAARLSAYAEKDYAARLRRPRQVARQLRKRLLALLAENFPPDRLEQLFDEGRTLTDDQACALAFPPPTGKVD